MKKIATGLDKNQRQSSTDVLNQVLADEFVLYTKTRKFHWNVTGMQFKSLHEMFEEHYGDLEIKIDDVAERIRSLGFLALGSLEEFAKLTRLKEHTQGNPKADEMIEQLVNDHETLIRELREDIVKCEEEYNDVGTGDFLTSLLVDHEKMAWMLRSYLS
ncbi:DNA starvation/stationary phase protection protein [Aquimarina sp. U1-2]|uniref:Dps family protein n=1 Tax=Aquimarina sp. U1-2 TaxID=2823141 RepID=UPI001AEC908F|nr:DNA starvation/stationary phase protection protein [Aquimarina sp. U1-2]MBP2833787.1 DNA starvation/stationary phase protection protein [Aquimarina sp. U1-2]